MSLSLHPDRFWQLTPRELLREFKAQAISRTRAHNDQAWLAWHIAALSRVQAKDFPRLSSLQMKLPGKSKAQTPEEIKLNLKQVFLAFGGDPKELEKFDGK